MQDMGQKFGAGLQQLLFHSKHGPGRKFLEISWFFRYFLLFICSTLPYVWQGILVEMEKVWVRREVDSKTHRITLGIL
jgi:hypothetical protein